MNAALVAVVMLGAPSDSPAPLSRDAGVSLGAATVVGAATDSVTIAYSVFRFRDHERRTRHWAECLDQGESLAGTFCRFRYQLDALTSWKHEAFVSAIAVGQLAAVTGAALAGDELGRRRAAWRGRDPLAVRRSLWGGGSLIVSGLGLAALGYALPSTCKQNVYLEIDNDFACRRDRGLAGAAASLLGGNALRLGVGLVARGLAIRRAPRLSLQVQPGQVMLGWSASF